MPTLNEVQEALAAVIDSAIPELHCYPRIVDSIDPPAVIIWPSNPGGDYRVNMRMGSGAWRINITAYVPWQTTEASAYLLNEFIDTQGDKSIPKAIYEARNTIGFAASLDGMINYGARYQFGSMEVFGATIVVDVTT